jgi:hypothetical protein
MQAEPIVYQNFNNETSIVIRTGETIPITNFDENNYKFNSPSFYRFDKDNFDRLINKTFLKEFKKPYMIFADGFDIPQFNKIIFDQKTSELLNQQGLNIFLTELLVKYKGNRKYIDKGILSKELLDSFNFVDAKFESSESNLKQLRSFQLDSINDLIKNNNLTNVTVYTGEYFIESISHNYSDIKFLCCDLFLAEKIKDIVLQITNEINPIEIKFACTNWRYSAVRHLVMSYLINFEGKYSWYYNGSIDQLQNSLWFDLQKWNIYPTIVAGVAKLNSTTPLNLDLTVTTPVAISGKLSDLLLLPEQIVPIHKSTNLYSNVFCMIVNECEYTEPTANFSEKTLAAITAMRPFILVGQPRSLEYLKKYGFKTFDEFWDESYDQELNHESRLLKIFNIISYIESFSLQELNSIYLNILPILEHNQQVLKNLEDNEWPIIP